VGKVSPHNRLSAPEPLHSSHDLSSFACGEPALDDWLKRRARQNQDAGASRTYVVTSGTKVAGYYALAVGAVDHASAPGRIRRNMPNPVPVMVIGRLAVDTAFHGRGIGPALLRDAILRTLQAAEIAGIRAILVHAISDNAKRFYLKHGFAESPIDPMTLMIGVAEATASLTPDI
jgi:GNAT superfamily N-acetyltransferase